MRPLFHDNGSSANRRTRVRRAQNRNGRNLSDSQSGPRFRVELFAEISLNTGLSFTAHFGEPPAKPDKKKTPIVKKLRLLALESVTDELERPPH